MKINSDIEWIDTIDLVRNRVSNARQLAKEDRWEVALEQLFMAANEIQMSIDYIEDFEEDSNEVNNRSK